MPEGVEVKLSAELIKPLIHQHTLLSAEVTSNSRYAKKKPEGFDKFAADIQAGDIKVIDIQTKGKFMYWTFSNNWYLFCTFGMTGQWSPSKGKHPCLVLNYLSDGSPQQLVFNDPRHFGTIFFTQNTQTLVDKLNELGWDPLLHGLADIRTNFIYNKSQSTKPIGQIMMEQNVFAGVGNYIRAEALYLAKLSPWRAGNSLSRDEITTLCQACVDVMQESYKHQGATIQTYKTAYGEEGRYSSCFKVYGKKTDPLGNKIIKEDTPDGRTIHWCPTVQK
jgi:formamidopyrimidine-DNA glycosylase